MTVKLPLTVPNFTYSRPLAVGAENGGSRKLTMVFTPASEEATLVIRLALANTPALSTLTVKLFKAMPVKSIGSMPVKLTVPL